MTGNFTRTLAIAIGFAALTTRTCVAESLPRWEIGAGIGAIHLPDYRGSDQTRSYVVPIPYLIYRGEVLKIDRNSVRGTVFSSDRMEIDASLNGTLPVASSKNNARSGMADLRPTVEAGPTVNFHLWRSADTKAKLDFRVPVRAAISVENSPRHIGWLISPNLHLEVNDPQDFSGWHIGLVSGLIYNDRRYNAHFYSVGAADATPLRPSYSAAGGYSGAQLTLALSKRFPRYWIGGFARYDSLGGAVMQDSPLIRKRNAVLAGIGIAWIFGESAE